MVGSFLVEEVLELFDCASSLVGVNVLGWLSISLSTESRVRTIIADATSVVRQKFCSQGWFVVNAGCDDRRAWNRSFVDARASLFETWMSKVQSE